MKNFKWFMVGVALVSLVALGMEKAEAATITVSWTAPTQNTDGSAIPASGAGSIVSTRVEYGSCSGSAFGTKTGEIIVNAPATSTPIVLGPGTYCFRAFAKNTYGAESVASNVAQKVVPNPVPNPPVVTVDITAYAVKPNETLLAYVLDGAVGTVQLGVPCDASRSMNGQDVYYAVNRSKYVTWTGKRRPTTVVVRCAAA